MPDPVGDLGRSLRAALAGAADPVRAPAMQAYMKSTLPFRGVPAPTLAPLCREAIATHPLPDRASWEAAVLELWDHAAYREERYAALAVAGDRRYRAHQTPEALPLYRHLVVTGAWWDLVDTIASHRVGPILRGHPAEVAPVLRGWAVDEGEALKHLGA